MTLSADCGVAATLAALPGCFLASAPSFLPASEECGLFLVRLEGNCRPRSSLQPPPRRYGGEARSLARSLARRIASTRAFTVCLCSPCPSPYLPTFPTQSQNGRCADDSRDLRGISHATSRPESWGTLPGAALRTDVLALTALLLLKETVPCESQPLFVLPLSLPPSR